ncbi:MAG TPA: hypothetical protein DCL41_07110 [Bdellovibrionales bacterium]|nr:hypothetical protein [Pseudobdellovibrionaceae bacterium]HAG91623.1 hypothetical protein [Bdellovibrionales bacterium]|tara:strand:+ start:454 stop:819 length:366 start_codon:yes stop_codon:yes gene_type:complete
MKSLILIATLLLSTLSFAQKENLDPMRFPKMQEGKLFTVKITPTGKKLDILVTGKKAATLEVSELGLTATLHSNGKVYQLSPKKNLEGEGYSMELPVKSKSRLKLDLQYKKDAESFDIPLN